MITYRLGQLIFIDIVTGIMVFIYYLLFLLSANDQEKNIQKVDYLKVYSILFLSITVFSSIVDVIYFFITTESFNLFFVLLYFGLISIGVVASIPFIIYSYVNKEQFGVFLYITAILLTIGYLMVNTQTNIINTLYLIGIDVSQIQFFFMLFSPISVILGISSLVLLLIHGFKNSDTFLIAAGFLRIAQIIYSMIAPIFISFLSYT